jgi:hypothetical protein
MDAEERLTEPLWRPEALPQRVWKVRVRGPLSRRARGRLFNALPAGEGTMTDQQCVALTLTVR